MSENNKNSIFNLLIILAIPYLVPAGLTQFSFFSVISKMKYISIAIVLMLTFRNGKIRVNKFVFNVFLFDVVLLVITTFKGADIIGCLKQGIDMLFAVLWIYICLRINSRRILRFLHRYYLLVAILNFILIVIFPSGIIQTASTNAIKLLGDDNKMLYTLLPAFGISFYYILTYYENNKKKVLVITALIYFSSIAYIWAVTGILAFILVFTLYYFDQHSEWARKLFNLRNCIIAIAGIFYLAVFSNSLQEGVFGNFITNVLNKPINFSGRTTLWIQAVDKIFNSPMLGYGFGEENVYAFSFSGASGILSGFSCHDGYLRLLLEGGAVIMVMYLLIYYRVYRDCRQAWSKNKDIHILAYAATGFLLGCIFEAEYTSFIYLVMLAILSQSGATMKAGVYDKTDY